MRSSMIANRVARTLITRQAVFSTITQRPFRILGLQQIAIGSLDKNSLKHLWGDILGVPTVSSGIRITSENVDEDILQLGTAPHAVEIDLMSPIDADTSPKVRSSDDATNVGSYSTMIGTYPTSQPHRTLGR